MKFARLLVGFSAAAVLLAACATFQPRLSLTPSETTLLPNFSQEFTAIVTGYTSGVTWEATCGAISGTGNRVTYTAPGSAQTCTVTATSNADPLLTDTSTVNVSSSGSVIQVTADFQTSATSVGSFSFFAGETRWFEVDLTPTAQSQEALFFELGTASAVELTLFSPSGDPLASTTRANAFFNGTSGVSSAAFTSVDVSPASVTTTDTCEGVCVIQPTNSATFYARVRNATGDRLISVYPYARPYYDDEETLNDSESNPVLLPGDDFDSGAIERIGDVDYWQVQQDGFITFSEYADADVIERRVLVIFGSGTAGPYSEEDPPFEVFAGETLKVYEAGNDAAGPAAFSGYTLEHNTAP